jgi:hypothetical protein
MYLMDHIVEGAHLARKHRLVNSPIMSIFPLMEDKLRGAPRYLFNEDTIHTAVELTLGRPKVLREAMANLTIPYPVMWIEWPESGREKLRQTFSIDSYEYPERPLPQRLGFLLESENGRKGTVTWAWTNHMIGKHHPPNVCPIQPYFDLDFNYSKLTEPMFVKSFLDANLANIWKDNKIQLDALLSIWHTAYHKPSKWGEGFIKESPKLPAAIYGDNQERRLANFYADVYGEYIMIWSCLMLLTSSKKIVEYEQVDMSKLNKVRRLTNKPLKLDHTIVSLYLSEKVGIHQQGMPLGYLRKSPRIHMVSSYLNRRGDKHWVVQPFWRGKGEVISRHVKVKP